VVVLQQHPLQVFSEDLGVGGVLGLLWFRRRLPIYFSQFIEMVLVVTADHGPAVSGAHNTIVCARAGVFNKRDSTVSGGSPPVNFLQAKTWCLRCALVC
jgi:hypothetical protein